MEHLFRCASGSPDLMIVVPATIAQNNQKVVGFKIEQTNGQHDSQANMIMHINDVRVLRDLLNRVLEESNG